MKNQPSFYVYTHARPDGSIFYVGKGYGRRAWDFAPTRRTLHHRNIAKRYGLQAILVAVYPQPSEQAAFDAERKMIAGLVAQGASLINCTEGGEGCYGREPSEKQRAALKRGRGRERALSEEAKRRILDGLARGREKRQANGWRPVTEATREKMRTARLGKKLGPRSTPMPVERRERISAALKGRSVAPIVLAARVGKKRGPHSPEHRAKIVAANTGKPKSDEARAKMSAAKLGKPWSEARRAACLKSSSQKS